jgi:hypothetical protein
VGLFKGLKTVLTDPLFTVYRPGETPFFELAGRRNAKEGNSRGVVKKMRIKPLAICTPH